MAPSLTTYWKPNVCWTERWGTEIKNKQTNKKAFRVSEELTDCFTAKAQITALQCDSWWAYVILCSTEEAWRRAYE